MQSDLFIVESVQLEGKMELEYGVGIGIFNKLLFTMPGYAMEEFLVIHVEVDILLF